MRQLVFVLPVVVVTLLVVLVVLTSAAAHILKRRFPATWAAEGEPHQWLWLQRTTFEAHVFGFLDERRYEAAGDPNYSRFCAAIRGAWYAFFILLVVSGGAMAAVLLGSGNDAA